jgi:hypothetical protein
MGRIPGRRKWEQIQISRARALAINEISEAEKKRSEAVTLFGELGLQALRVVHHILTLPNDRDSFDSDLAHHRRLTLQANAAQSLVANAIKVDDAPFRDREREDWLESFNKRLDEAQAKLLKPRQEQNPRS